ncbi:MAG: cyclodeaminase/cyclohydrolase family protein [Phycisphaerales bacterium]|nr:cyclodeaminase/cyclohydrolase family protein [Phycisphaerales bacterium]
MPDILQLPVQDFLAATAAMCPTPGGGSVTALCGALAASLATMALRYTVGKKAYAAHDAALKTAITELQSASARFQELITEDIAAYEALSAMLKLTEPQRLAHPDYAATVVAAIRAPRTAADLAAATLDHCLALRDKTSKFLISDLAIAATYAHATVHASEFNVLINLPLLANKGKAVIIRQNLIDLVAKADKNYDMIRTYMRQTPWFLNPLWSLNPPTT